MTERDFLSLKREMWNIISKEGLIVTNQNLDWILERTYKSVAKMQGAMKEQNEQQAIEDMARTMCRNFMPNGNCASDGDPCCLECVYGYCAERIYCADYRKQTEGEWMFHKDGSGTCNQCKTTQKDVWDMDNYQSYCGHCGAKMKGGA